MTPPRLALLLLVLLAILQLNYYAPRLPDPVATHFDDAGQPNGWSPKSEFVLTNLVLDLGLAVLFVGLGSLLPKIPNDWINLPHKDYWLAPERRDATMSAMQKWADWFGVATLALLIAMTQLTIQANLTGEPLGNASLVLLGAYLLFMLGWVVWMLRWAYSAPRAGHNSLEGGQ